MTYRRARAWILVCLGLATAIWYVPPLAARWARASAAQAPGTLFVSNYSGNRVTAYPGTATGNAPLSFSIPTLAGPHQIAVNVGADELIVVSNSAYSVVAYDEETGAAKRTIVGVHTGLNRPTGVAVDEVHQELFVTNDQGNSITVYDLGAEGDATPKRVIAGAATGLGGPVGLAIDPFNDEIVVANYRVNGFGSAITVYARAASGDAAPLRTIAGPLTTLNVVQGVAIDSSRDQILVSNGAFMTPDAGAILIFRRTAANNEAPVRTIAGPATSLCNPMAVAFDHTTDEIVAANSAFGGGTCPASVTVYAGASSGNAAPIRTLTGPAAGLSNPISVAVDSGPFVIVRAGPAQTVSSGAPVTLPGSAHATPPGALSYAWTQTGPPEFPMTLQGATGPTATFTAPTLPPGAPAVTLDFLLTVTTAEAVGTATVSVTVVAPVVAPTADAGPAQTVDSAAAVELSGSGLDHNTPPRPLTYSWVQTGGPIVSLLNATSPHALFTAPLLESAGAPVTLTFALTVGNGVAGLDATASTTVTVIAPPLVAPTAAAGLAQIAVSGRKVTLTGSGSDHNHPIRPVTYSWAQTSGTPVTLTAADTPTPTFVAPAVIGGGSVTLEFQLTVSNGLPNLTAAATATVKVSTGWAIAGQYFGPGVTVYPRGAEGDVAPDRQFATPAGPHQLAINYGANELIVVSNLSSSVTVHDVGTSVPKRTIAGPLTGLNRPTGTAVDETHQELYVANDFGNSVTVFALSASGNVAPKRTIVGDLTGFNGPVGIVIDLVHDEIVLSNFRGGGSITSYPRTANGNVAPLRTIAGSLTGFNLPQGLILDPGRDEIVVANSFFQTANVGQILSFARTANGNQAPVRTLAGPATKLCNPMDLTFDATVDEIVVTNSNDGAGTCGTNLATYSRAATGDAAPLRMMGGPSSGFAIPLGVTQFTAPKVLAAAGQPLTVQSGLPVQLTGSARTTPLGMLTYAWTQTGPADVTVALTGAATPTPTFTAPIRAPGAPPLTLDFLLTVSLGDVVGTATTSVTVIAPVAAPTADAGADQTVASGGSATLAGSGTDPNTPPQTLTYAWTQTSGIPVTLTGANTATASFTAPALNNGAPSETLTFQLMVGHTADALTAMSTTTVTVTSPAVAAPTAHAGDAQTAASGGAVTLAGSGTDPNTPPRTLTYAWSQTSGIPVTLTGANTATASFTAPALNNGAPSESMTFQLTVGHEGDALTGTSITTVTVTSPAVVAPTASAGEVQTIASGGAVTLAGSGTDPNTPPRTLTYAWTQTSGMSVTLTGANTATASFTAPALNNGAPSETLTFQLTVGHEGDALTGTSITTVTVTSPAVVAPTATAGEAQTIASGGAVTLAGSGTDPNTPPRTLTYAWTQTSGIPVTLTGANTATASFTAPALNNGAPSETLTFQLTVGHIADGLTATSTTTVTVTSPPVVAPTANAGDAQAVASGGAVTLAGSGTDLNTPPRTLTYAWTQTSGIPVTLTGANTATASFAAPALNNGAPSETLSFQLTVGHAADGLTGTSATTVTVLAPAFVAPTASAGPPQIVTSTNAVTLHGAGADHNSPPRPLTYSWTQIGGPAVVLSNAATPSASFVAPVLSGAAHVALVFELTVSNGLVSLDRVASTTVTVSAGLLFVANYTGGNVTVYPGAAAGNMGPGYSIATDPGPHKLAVNAAANELIVVSNTGFTVSTFDAGTGVLKRKIAGLDTGLNRPTGLAIDLAHHELFVANDQGQSITVFDLSAHGNVAPKRKIFGPATGLSGPAGVALDLAHDEVFVANYRVPGTGGKITVYSRTANGDVAPARTIAGSLTGLDLPQGLAFDDGRGQVVVANSAFLTANPGHVSAFERTASGNVAPVRTIGGTATKLCNPMDVSVQSAGDEIVVSNSNFGQGSCSIGASTFTGGAAGNVAPVRTLAGAGVLMSNPSGVTMTTAPAVVVDAGPPQTVASATAVTLAGSGSTSPPAALSYTWIQTGGIPVVLTDANAATATFTAPPLVPGANPEALTFQLTVTHPTSPSLTASASTTVTVNAPPPLPPTANAGDAQTVASGSAVTLAGSGTDLNTPPRALTYAWTQTSGSDVTLTGANTATATFTAPTLNNGASSETLTFQLTVGHMADALTGTSTVTVTVTSPPVVAPTANAGDAQTIASGAAVTLAGSGADSNTPPRALTYAWTQTSGIPVTLSGANNATATFTAPALNNGAPSETLTFLLTVGHTADALTGTSTVTVTVTSPPVVAPTANAGDAQTIASGAAVTLAGSGADSNTPPRALTYAWTQTSGIPVTLSGADSATATFTAPALNNGAPSETLTFLLTVGHTADALTGTSTVTVTVTSPPVVAPTANAGDAQTVASGSAVTLGGSGTDLNTPPRALTYAWTQTSGIPVTLSGADSATATFTAPALNNGAPSETLTFLLTVGHTADALTGTSTVTVTVTSPPVVAPTANAGDAQTIASGGAVTLAGSGEDSNTPPRALTYAWTQTSGIPVTLSGADSATATFTAPALNNGAPSETLTFLLTVGHTADALTGTSTVTVTVTSPPVVAPTANAGDAQTIASGAAVTLAGSGEDSNTPPRALTYAWTQTSGIPVTLSGADSATATFTAPALNNGAPSETLTFLLTVGHTADALTGTSTVTVTVTSPPVVAPTANAGDAQTVASGSAVTLAGSGADSNTPPRALTYAWTQTSGIPVTLSGANSATATFTAPALNNGAPSETLTFLLTVGHTADALTGTSTVTVTVTSPPVVAPTANAGDAQTIASGAAVTLAGSGADSNTPPRALTYAWTQTSGIPVTLSGANSATATFTAPALNNGAPSETLTFLLTVGHTADALTGTSTVTVTVTSPPVVAPTANAGDAQTIASGGAVTLAGSGADSNTPPRALTYAWTQTSGIPVTLTGANGATATFTAPALNNGAPSETLTFQLTVGHEGDALTGTSTTTVTVTSPAVLAPTASAGDAQTIASGGAVTLAGSGTDSNTPPRALTYAWTQTSGIPVTLTGASGATATFTAPALNNGAPSETLTFLLTVGHEGDALTATATTSVTVIAPVAAPTADAGAAQAVASGGSVTLTGSGTDPNTPPRTLTYAWTQTSGIPVTLTGANTATASFTAPTLNTGAPSETLTFQLTVGHEGDAQTATSTTTVNVTSPPVAAPTANAGDAQTVASGGAATLAGSGTDSNTPPRALTYAWTQTSGIPVTLTGANTATASFTAPPLNNGAPSEVLTFQLTVGHESDALTGTSTTTVTVTAPAVLPPTVTVGEPQTVPSGAAVTLSGSGADENTPPRALTFLWTQIGGIPVALSGATTTTPGFIAPLLANGAAPSALTFQLTVGHEADAVTGAATTTVTVTAPPVLAPAANAGTAQTVASGAAVTLSGSGTDPNTPPIALTYEWAQTSGTPVTLSNATAAVASFTAPAIAPGGAGTTLEFTLTVRNGTHATPAVTTVAVTPPPAIAGTTAGLVAAFTFDEGAGGSVADLSGHANHGVISGATWSGAGRSGSALSFDGVSNWVTIPDAPSLGLTTGMTLEAWVRPTTSTGWVTIIYKERPVVGDQGLAWALYSSDFNAPPAVYGAMAGNFWTHATGSSLLPLNAWSHVVGTYDGATLRVYVNGVQVGTRALAGPMLVTPGALRFGGHENGGQFFKGLIDEVRIFNRALSPAEIQADMAASTPLAVAVVTPAAEAAGVAATTAVAATFNQPLTASSVTDLTVTLTDAASLAVPATVAYNAATNTATLVPSSALANFTTYTVRIKGGPGGVADGFGRPLAADYTWTFTTALGTSGPAITGIAVAPSTTSAVITWTTNRPSTSRVDFGTTAGSLATGATDTALVTSHSMTLSGLTANRIYFFRVTSIDDTSNVSIAPAPPAAPATFATNPVGLVAAFSFNEGTGATVGDTSGFGNTGTISGATWTASGRYGAGLSFNGSSNLITISPSPSLDLTTGMTLEAWVRPVNITGWQPILYKQRPASGGGTSGLAWALYSSDFNAPPAVYAASPTNLWSHATGSSNLPLNTWTHVVGTYDGAALRLYVNGNLVRTVIQSGSTPITAGSLRIGGNGTGQFFRGVIDEIRIYNRALSVTEIRADMAAPLR